ncbi:hypothetical protein H0H92_011722 [Tricholoma furcatifolium]|nr:hypothetical protein H0H92_011722 [Tricholoma furcatifolium]
MAQPTEPTVTWQDEEPNRLREVKVFGYREGRRGWRHVSEKKYQEQQNHPSSITIISWNLHHRAPHKKERILTALRHLETYVFKCAEGQTPVASCIMLQEVHKEALMHLLEDSWVRKHFVVTPISADKWPHDYGNVTLVERSVVVEKAGHLTYGYSNARRSALVVDLKASSPSANKPRDMVIRMINTHLEPKVTGFRMRRVQLEVLAKLLKDKTKVRGGVIAGGMNAILPEDSDIPKDLSLEDAWQRPDKHAAGITWGYQTDDLNTKDFPPARLDRVLYLPRRKSYALEHQGRVGMGLLATNERRETVGWWIGEYIEGEDRPGKIDEEVIYAAKIILFA